MQRYDIVNGVVEVDGVPSGAADATEGGILMGYIHFILMPV